MLESVRTQYTPLFDLPCACGSGAGSVRRRQNAM
jgi:hypothetical protein